MHVAFIANTSWYLYNLRLGIFKFLLQRGVNVTIISPKDEYTAKLMAAGCHFIHIEIDNRGMNPWNDLRLGVQLYRIFQQEQFDTVFTYTIKPNIFGGLAAGLCQQRTVTVLSGRGYSLLQQNLLSRLVKNLYRLATRTSAEMWFVNCDDHDFFTQHQIVAAAKCRLLPGEGVNTRHFYPSPRPNTATKIHFLFSGRLIWSKGLQHYVEAAQYIQAKYPYTQFNLLGFFIRHNADAVTEEQVQEWHEQGVINYMGSTSDVRPYLQQTDCFILPSYYGEGTPRSLLEAASMEIPIITTDSLGCREVVDDRVNGFLCEPKNTVDLIGKIEQFLELSVEDQRTMGKAGRKKVQEQFREELVIQHYADFLQLTSERVAERVNGRR